MSTWFGLVMPRETPRPIVERVNAEIMKVLASPDVVDKLRAMGVDAAAPHPPAKFEQFMQDDVARWKKVVADAAIVLD
jgi:tripartite-type tricarboxylate transporter receptor subunit TctC